MIKRNTWPSDVKRLVTQLLALLPAAVLGDNHCSGFS